MKRFIAVVVLLLVPFPGTNAARAQEKTPAKTDQERIREARTLFDRITVDTSDLQKEMPLERFLEVVAKQIPKGDDLTLKIEKEAFGKNYPAQKPVKLPRFPKKMALATAVRLARSQAGTPVDYRIEPGTVILTTPERALFSLTYCPASSMLRMGNQS